VWRQSETVGKCISTIASDSQFASCAFVRSESEILGVDVWRDTQINSDDLVLLRIFVRLLNHMLPHEISIRESKVARTEARHFPSGYFVGKSKAITKVHREIEPLCDSNLPILLVGETGVGKEMLAHLIHQWSGRAQGPFIAVNCAAIPAELLESEMFGIEKGVATGVHEREGYFQRARGGTLFLDEISEMSAALQAKLLRALQEKEIQQVGGLIVKADVRFIAATNSDLQQRMQDGRFRSDLYYRIAGTVVRVPPLRERKEDIAPLAQHFAELYGRECGKRIVGTTVSTLELLSNYAWPGNIRELAHEVRRLVHLCPHGKAIEGSLLSDKIVTSIGIENHNYLHTNQTLQIETRIEELERSLIREALAQARGNQSRAARLLGISRNGLAIKMARLGIKT
jgi:Nif-specific regulatory protein